MGTGKLSIKFAILYLSDYLNEYIDSIPPRSDKGKSIRYLKSIDFKNIINKNEYTETISKCFRPSELILGTIGSFLFGGIQNNYGDINKSCSLYYIEGMNILSNSKLDDNPENKLLLCKYSIWKYNSNKTNKYNRLVLIQNNDKTSEGLIYINSQFDGFTTSEILLLKQKKIVLVTLLETKNSRHYLISRNISLDKLPRKNNSFNESRNEILNIDILHIENDMMIISLSILLAIIIIIYCCLILRY